MDNKILKFQFFVMLISYVFVALLQSEVHKITKTCAQNYQKHRFPFTTLPLSPPTALRASSSPSSVSIAPFTYRHKSCNSQFDLITSVRALDCHTPYICVCVQAQQTLNNLRHGKDKSALYTSPVSDLFAQVGGCFSVADVSVGRLSACLCLQCYWDARHVHGSEGLRQQGVEVRMCARCSVVHLLTGTAVSRVRVQRHIVCGLCTACSCVANPNTQHNTQRYSAVNDANRSSYSKHKKTRQKTNANPYPSLDPKSRASHIWAPVVSVLGARVCDASIPPTMRASVLIVFGIHDFYFVTSTSCDIHYFGACGCALLDVSVWVAWYSPNFISPYDIDFIVVCR